MLKGIGDMPFMEIELIKIFDVISVTSDYWYNTTEVTRQLPVIIGRIHLDC